MYRYINNLFGILDYMDWKKCKTTMGQPLRIWQGAWLTCHVIRRKVFMKARIYYSDREVPHYLKHLLLTVIGPFSQIESYYFKIMIFSYYLVVQVCTVATFVKLLKWKTLIAMAMCLYKISLCLQPLKFLVSSCLHSISCCRRSIPFNVPCSSRLVPKKPYYTKYFSTFIDKANLQHFMWKKMYK